MTTQKYRRSRQLEATRQGSTNSTSRIDSVARILFPLSFGLFNITYWYSYFHAQKPFDWDDHMLKGTYFVRLFQRFVRLREKYFLDAQPQIIRSRKRPIIAAIQFSVISRESL